MRYLGLMIGGMLVISIYVGNEVATKITAQFEKLTTIVERSTHGR